MGKHSTPHGEESTYRGHGGQPNHVHTGKHRDTAGVIGYPMGDRSRDDGTSDYQRDDYANTPNI